MEGRSKKEEGRSKKGPDGLRIHHSTNPVSPGLILCPDLKHVLNLH